MKQSTYIQAAEEEEEEEETVVNGNVQVFFFYTAHPSNVHLSPRPSAPRTDSAGKVPLRHHLSFLMSLADVSAWKAWDGTECSRHELPM